MIQKRPHMTTAHARPPAPDRAWSIVCSGRRRRRGFSLTEILVVVALVVILLALAVPAFNFITGGRSVDVAQNTISAMIARARTEAIGLQEVRGVFFFQEVTTGRVQVAIVRETERPGSSAPFTSGGGVVPRVDVFLDLTPESEFVALPRGVGLQTITEANFNASGNRIDDGYFGFNRRNRGNGQDIDTITPYGGVILFDGSGRLISRHYAFKTYTGSDPDDRTRIGDLLLRPTGALLPVTSAVYDVVPSVVRSFAGSPFPARSQLGVVLFDNEQFRGRPQDVSPNSPRPEEDFGMFHLNPGAYSLGQEWDERSKEDWIDQNGLLLLVNRYNGTLVRAE